MLVAAEDLATRDVRERFGHIGLRPGQIVTLLGRALGDAFIDELTHRVLDRGKVATGNMSVEPSLLFGCERDCHAPNFTTRPASFPHACTHRPLIRRLPGDESSGAGLA